MRRNKCSLSINLKKTSPNYEKQEFLLWPPAKKARPKLGIDAQAKNDRLTLSSAVLQLPVVASKMSTREEKLSLPTARGMTHSQAIRDLALEFKTHPTFKNTSFIQNNISQVHIFHLTTYPKTTNIH
jgi:hypothetical protein